MLEALNYYYNITLKNINYIDGGAYFFYNDYKYYYLLFDRPEEELLEIAEVSNALYSKKIYVHTFIKTKEDAYFSLIDNKKYVLLRVNSISNSNVNLKEIVAFNNAFIFKNKKISISWGELWSKKVDKFEEFMLDIENEYELIQMSCDYYIGLAENAISYFNDAIDSNENEIICISHNRIGDDFYNPINYLYDYNVRDIVEYLKYCFFKDIDTYEEFYKFIKSKKINEFSAKILFSRLMYPSFYFDDVIKVMDSELEEDELKKYVYSSKKYEKFLYECYVILNKYYNIPPVFWLNSLFN